MISHGFDSFPNYVSLESLTDWLPEGDNVLSVTCHKKGTQLFNTLKCHIGKCIAEIHWLTYIVQECFDEWKHNLLRPRWDHSNHGELQFCVKFANLCSWPKVLFVRAYILVRLQNIGIYRIYNLKALCCDTWVKEGHY